MPSVRRAPIALTSLFVEGNLDAELLTAVMRGRPTVRSHGGRYGIVQRIRLARDEVPETAYIRDRDFDYEPPRDFTSPVVDRRQGGEPLGWRWCRHEIENYLIDPGLVHAAMGWSTDEYAAALVTSAKRIRHYQVARWVVGAARRALPPQHELSTRPAALTGDFRLPVDLSAPAVFGWARENIAQFVKQVEAAMAASAVDDGLTARAALLTEAVFEDATTVAVWCSGKDLLAALAPWLIDRGVEGAGQFRNRLRDWVMLDPELALAALPEWRALVDVVRR